MQVVGEAWNGVLDGPVLGGVDQALLSPVTIMLCPAILSLRRSSRTSKASISPSRPVSAGGRVPAPGAYGLRLGSTPRSLTPSKQI